MESKICLVDMDNSLFDYEGQMRRDLSSMRSPNEPDPLDVNFDLWDESVPWIKTRMDFIKDRPGWWENLPLLPSGLNLYQAVIGIGFCPKIYTKGPFSRTNAWAEKVRAIHKHFPGVTIDIVGEDKEGTYGRVLIDDYPDYIEGWLKWRPRGLVIMPAHSYNSDFTHDNVIRYDGTNMDEVQNALVAAYNRTSKEHWKEYIS